LVSDEFSGAFGIQAADVDHDGDMDILGASDYSGVVSLWINDGAHPPQWTRQIIDGDLPGANAVFPVDVDGNGLIDVVGSAADPSNCIVWWRNEGGNPLTWTRHTIQTDWVNAFEVYAGDVDGDGDADLLSASYTLGRVGWWRNDGGSPVHWTAQVVDSSFAGAHSVCIADLDGDGDQDLAGAAASANATAWWRNDGGDPIVWTRQIIDSQFTGARSVRAGDIDGDGRDDIVGTCWAQHVAWWRNDDQDPTLWTKQVIDAAFPGGHSVQVADVDGDGDLDVLGAGYSCHDIRWWENGGGSPIVWVMHLVDGSCRNALEVCTADVDGDGDLDVLGTSYYWGQFLWYEALEFQSSGELTGSILDTQEDPLGVFLAWSHFQPAGATLAFRVRSSDDPVNMGSWSGDISTPGPFPPPAGRYLQYKILLETTDADSSPILTELSADPGIDPTGVANGGLAERPAFRWSPNPTRAPIRVETNTEEECRLVLRVFGVDGRDVGEVREGAVHAGVHQVGISGLRPGVYLCRAVAGRWNEVQRVTVLR
jgi:hypothetical protein